MNKFNFKRRSFTQGPHILGPILIVAGVFALVSPSIFEAENSPEKVFGVGGGAILLGMLIINSYGGMLIDLSEQKYMAYFSVVGYKFGTWVPMPEIKRISVFSNSYIRINTPNGISPTFSGKVRDYVVQISSYDMEPLFSFTYSNKRKAIKQAEKLASKTNSELNIHIAG